MKNLPVTKKDGSLPALTFEQKMAKLRKETGRAERFVLNAACALKDQEFLVTMERFEESVFKIVSIDKVMKTLGQEKGKASEAKPRTFKGDEVDFKGWKCPWCLSTGIAIHCGDCSSWVCDGGTQGPEKEARFKCRPSCGAEGTLRSVSEIHGADGRSGKANSARATLSGPTSPRLPGNNAPKLPRK